MNTRKQALHELIDALPEDVSADVLEQVRLILEAQSIKDRNLSSILTKIFEEDKELLTKLAQ